MLLNLARTARIKAGRFSVFIHKILSPATLATLTVALIGSWLLFVAPQIGVADNGDFFRVFSGNGLYTLGSDYEASQFGYFIKEYGIYQFFNEQGNAFFSSQNLFVQVAITLNKVFFSQKVFHISFLAAVYFLFYLTAFYLFVKGLTMKLAGWTGYLVAFLAVFIFGDLAYLAYFNSFYAEGLMLIAMLFIAASFLWFDASAKFPYLMLLVFVFGSLLLITAKQQNAPLALILTLSGLTLLTIQQERKFRLLVWISLAVIFISGVLTYVLIPKTFVTINQYQTMSQGVLLKAQKPEKALRDLDMNPQFALLKGTTYYQKYKMIDPDSELIERAFYDDYSFGSVLQFYLTHPSELAAMLEISTKQAFQIRPHEMGNYDKSAQKPFAAKSHFFSLYSDVKAKMTPPSVGLLILLSLVFLASYNWKIPRRIKQQDKEGLVKGALAFLLVATGFAVIAISFIGDGEADLAKHEFLFNVCFDLALLIGIASLGKMLSDRRNKSK
ncbi:hypothetical protein [Listeria valentina]|uniref:glycan biosynthesis hexose transferase WsfD n=1 Tax=Listeria valentina TaxID=2705293 RepID=UPI00143025A6|nr:hypothetical protein [Listeria valentina]